MKKLLRWALLFAGLYFGCTTGVLPLVLQAVWEQIPRQVEEQAEEPTAPDLPTVQTVPLEPEQEVVPETEPTVAIESEPETVPETEPEPEPEPEPKPPSKAELAVMLVNRIQQLKPPVITQTVNQKVSATYVGEQTKWIIFRTKVNALFTETSTIKFTAWLEPQQENGRAGYDISQYDGDVKITGYPDTVRFVPEKTDVRIFPGSLTGNTAKENLLLYELNRNGALSISKETQEYIYSGLSNQSSRVLQVRLIADIAKVYSDFVDFVSEEYGSEQIELPKVFWHNTEVIYMASLIMSDMDAALTKSQSNDLFMQKTVALTISDSLQAELPLMNSEQWEQVSRLYQSSAWDDCDPFMFFLGKKTKLPGGEVVEFTATK